MLKGMDKEKKNQQGNSDSNYTSFLYYMYLKKS